MHSGVVGGVRGRATGLIFGLAEKVRRLEVWISCGRMRLREALISFGGRFFEVVPMSRSIVEAPRLLSLGRKL